MKIIASVTLLLISSGIFYTHVFAVKESIRTAGFIRKFDERQLEHTFSKPFDDFMADKTLTSKSLCRTLDRCIFRQTLDEYALIPGSNRYRSEYIGEGAPLE